MLNSGPQEQPNRLRAGQHPAVNPISQLAKAVQAGPDAIQDGVLVEERIGVADLRDSSKNAAIIRGRYDVTEAFEDGLAVRLNNGVIAFVDTVDVISWERHAN